MKAEPSVKSTETLKQASVQRQQAETAASLQKLANDSRPKLAEQPRKQKPTKAEKPSIKKHVVENKPGAPLVALEPKPGPKNTILITTRPTIILKKKKQLPQPVSVQTVTEEIVSSLRENPVPELPAIEVDDDYRNASVALDFDNVVPTIELLPDDFDIAETGILLQDELIFDDETLETFTKLLELVTAEQSPAPISVPELSLLEDQVVLFSQESSENTAPNAFKKFVTEHPAETVILSIDEIWGEADEHPLEESILRLVSLLKEVPGENEDLAELVSDLAESFLWIDDKNHHKHGGVRITPEITQKLLGLLRLIGYQNPGEVLLDFITRHDLEFLVQALRYLAQLARSDSQHEFIPAKSLGSFLKDETKPIATLIGKVILEFIKQDSELSTAKA